MRYLEIKFSHSSLITCSHTREKEKKKKDLAISNTQKKKRTTQCQAAM